MPIENLGLIETIKHHIINYINNPDAILALLSHILSAILIFWIGKKIAKIIANISAKALEKADVDLILVNFTKSFVYFALLATVIIASLGQLGFKTTSLLGIFAAAGLAIGLALKDSLSNFAAGVMLVIFRPFKIGDFVEVAGLSGKIEEIKIFSTVLVTGDNKQITIPNGQITSESIVNYSAKKTRRIDLTIGVSYDDDLKQVKKILTEVVSAHPLVLTDPAPKVALAALADSSVNFTVRPWSNSEDYWTIYSDLLEQMKAALEEGGCSLPYPQTDVYLHQVN
jgi:small conductance mechanosensitive channel